MKFWHLFREAFLSVLDNIFYLLSFLIPKNKNIWVFGGLLGEGYNDNSKYFFEYINENKANICSVWISQNTSVVTGIRGRGYRAYKGYSLKGCWFAMRAGVMIISHSRVRDLRPFVVTSRVQFIQLWHGIPLKKIEYDDTVFFNKPTLFTKLGFAVMRIISPAFRRKFDLFIACSTKDRKSFSSAFRLETVKIKITGYPRNDVVFAPANNRKNELEKRVLYVPTFRGHEKSDFYLFEKYSFNCQKMNAFLKKVNMRLYVKLHPYNRPTTKLLEEIEAAGNMEFYEEVDIYSTLNSFDILITDYSSIYFDFLLLDRPVIFAPFDMEAYLRSDRELYYKYDDVTPGPKANNWDDIQTQLTLFSQGKDKYADLRQKVKNKFHFFQNNGSCERVYQQVCRLL